MVSNTNSKILWANQAGYFLVEGHFCMATDPWYAGEILNFGWSLISKTNIDYSIFEHVKYLWFSHEHPDHFHPPTIKSIPEEFREDITVLFQQTKDKRVLEYCKRVGFRTIELQNKWYDLDDNVSVFCEKNGIEDSWIITKTPNWTILNLNDCVITDRSIYEKILSLCNNKIDVLFSQFGYAERVGNPDQTYLREQEALFWMNNLKRQCEILMPKHVIPCATFKYYSHQENYYMNDGAATPQAVTEILSPLKETKTIILYSGDEWKIGAAHDNQQALRLYADDWAKKHVVTQTSESVPLEKIRTESEKYKKELSHVLPAYLIYLQPVLPASFVFNNVRFYLSDLDLTFTFKLKGADLIEQGRSDKWDLELHSSSLLFLFAFPFGANTLLINARFITSHSSAMSKLFNLSHIGLMLSAEEKFDLAYILGNAMKIAKILFKRKTME